MAEPKVINWGCGEHPFLLRIGECEALDDLTPAGIADFRYRLAQGVERGALAHAPVKTREVINCIRLGLIGGGMDAEEARKLALRGHDECSRDQLNMVCYGLLTAALAGKDHDKPGKRAAAGRKRRSASASPPAMETGP
ncbi:hypothetical protein CKO11_12350 [Rhodobacter sp. TJ_12]|uniref:GTA-gp10 family protein n=1 Tax=Rhodobacter sp. TJ_12 TaxID=2029399 RepID=UPI001CBB36E8|nr:GTA-gp10 family protein [Rhodobacter sp. TJ_12]MBZ4023249.1 hypothetical protein [Rhodobacter sp. TJ_12]